jgi:hypothetical protein
MVGIKAQRVSYLFHSVFLTISLCEYTSSHDLLLFFWEIDCEVSLSGGGGPGRIGALRTAFLGAGFTFRDLVLSILAVLVSRV